MATYVVCIDGTWNRPEDPDGDPIDAGMETSQETNVHRIFNFLADHQRVTESGLTKVAPLRIDPLKPAPGAVFYVAGVGASWNPAGKVLSGATGYGTMKRILLAYQFLAERYCAGDQIFGFGFSRGAYAVRSLAGLLHLVGLPTVPQRLNDSELNAIRDRYRSPGSPSGTSIAVQPAPVHFLGLWDTVMKLTHEPEDNSFHVDSPPNVDQVAHALALDEERQDFAPTLWSRGGPSTAVEEVWFPGVHSNVGGGYRTVQLSNIPLSWIVARAVAAGLPTTGVYIPQWFHEHVFIQMTDSYREFLWYLSWFGNLVKGSRERRTIRKTHSIHRSVFDRINGVKSLYVNSKAVSPVDWKRYEPTALIEGGHWADKETVFQDRLVETDDYLDKAIVEHHLEEMRKNAQGASASSPGSSA